MPLFPWGDGVRSALPLSRERLQLRVLSFVRGACIRARRGVVDCSIC